MAKPRRISSSAVARLAEELRFAPKAAARRIIERAESLASQVDADELYAEEWLTHQLTGFQTRAAAGSEANGPEASASRMVPGSAILADLGPLIDRLCVSAAYADEELAPPTWLGIDEMCARWRITRRTLERYRARGLPGRRVRLASGQGGATWVVRFRAADAGAFAARHAGVLADAASFSRLGPADADQILAAAAKLDPAAPSATAMARQIAASVGRSTGSVLRVLRDTDQGHRKKPTLARPVHVDPGALSLRSQRFAIPPAKVSRRTGLSPAALARRERLALSEALRAMDLAGPGQPRLVKRADAQSVLAQPWVQVGLGEPGAPDVRTLVAEATERSWADPVAERQRVAAVVLLRSRVVSALASLDPRRPTASALDRIATDLCWVSRLIAELVRSQEFAILQTVRTVCGQELLALPAAFVLTAWPAVMREAISAVASFDPSRGGRLASPVGLAVNRLLIVRWSDFITAKHQRSSRLATPTGGGERAVALALDDAASVKLADWTVAVHPSQAWCDAPRSAFYGAAGLKPAWRELLSARYGWGRYGQAGLRSAGELAAAKGGRLEQVRRTERAALAAAIRATHKPGH